MLPSAESCAGSRPDWVDPTDDSVFLPYTPPEVRETWKIGTKILAYDIRRCWCEAVVRKISSEREVLVHYQGWNKRWDHWLPLLSRRLRAKDEESRAASSHTNAATAGHSTQASRDERPSVRASVGGGSAAASPRGGDVSSSAADTAADSLAAQQGPEGGPDRRGDTIMGDGPGGSDGESDSEDDTPVPRVVLKLAYPTSPPKPVTPPPIALAACPPSLAAVAPELSAGGPVDVSTRLRAAEAGRGGARGAASCSEAGESIAEDMSEADDCLPLAEGRSCASHTSCYMDDASSEPGGSERGSERGGSSLSFRAADDASGRADEMEEDAEDAGGSEASCSHDDDASGKR